MHGISSFQKEKILQEYDKDSSFFFIVLKTDFRREKTQRNLTSIITIIGAFIQRP